MAAPTPRTTYLSLLAQPVNFAVWFGQLASAIGNKLFDMAKLWLVYEATGSTAAMSGVAVAGALPALIVGLWGGALLDRWDRLRTAMFIDISRTLVVAALPLLYWQGWLNAWALALFGALLAGLDGLFLPSLQAALASLVRPAELRSVNGLIDTTDRLARILGPGLAGVLLALLPLVHFFSLDAVSFIISALCFWLVVRSRPAGSFAAPGAAGRRAGWQEVVQGVRYARADGRTATALVVRGLNYAAWGFYTLGAPVLVDQRFHGSAGAWGLILATYGVGSLFGNLIAGHLRAGVDPLGPFTCGWVIIGLGFAGLGLSPSLPLGLASVLAAGVGGPLTIITIDTHIGTTVPPEGHGRVFALQRMLVSGGTALGLGVAGWALVYLPAGTGIALGGGFMVVAVVTGTWLQRQRGGE